MKKSNKGKKLLPVKKANQIPRTRKEKLKAIKAFSNSNTRKKQMDEANEMLRLHPFPLLFEVDRKTIKAVFAGYLTEPSAINALKLINIIQENTAYKVLMKLSRHNELIKQGRKIFTKDKIFIQYLFSEPGSLTKMPIEYLTDDEGLQVIMNELLKLEYGAFS